MADVLGLDIKDFGVSKTAMANMEVHCESHNNQQQAIATENEEEVEVELNLRYISLRDADLVSNFIASHGSEITLPTFKSPEVKGLAYTTLAELLLLLKNHSILDLLDNQRSLLVKLLEDLHHTFRFRGPWLDSLEIFMFENATHDSRTLKKLRGLEKKFKGCNDEIMRKWPRKSQGTGLTGLMQSFRKVVKYHLKIVMEERKAVSDARKSLNFFYPI